MTAKPSYLTHTVEERDVTVDWFYGQGHYGKKAVQLVLLLLGWLFVVLPVVVTASAIVNRHNDGAGWWGYHEGFVIWDVTMMFLGILTGFFLVAFLVLYLVNRAAAERRDHRTTYDEQRLVQRLEIADDWYASKFGPEALRGEQKKVQVEPYGDLETYELRGRYRAYGVE